MRYLLGVGLFYLVLTSILLAGGILLGSAVHWILPSLDYSAAVIVGVVGNCVSLLFLSRLLQAADKFTQKNSIEENEIEDTTSDEIPDSWPDAHPRLMFDIVPPHKTRGRKRRPGV